MLSSTVARAQPAMRAALRLRSSAGGWCPQRHLAAAATAPVTEIKKVGMVGLGLMGHGIAQIAATAGYEVVGVEMGQGALDAGRARIEGSVPKLLSRAVKKGTLTQDATDAEAAATLGRISYSTSLDALGDCDLIVEAIIEDIAIKNDFYARLDAAAKPSAIFGSNTSSLQLCDMAGATGRADRFVGLHFFNPVQLMKLVEVIKGDGTDPAVFELVRAWSTTLPGKVAVSCGDAPGFIVNRLLVPFQAQALCMHDRGDASIVDIDTAMRLGTGHPMGPFTLADYVGLDTMLSILQVNVSSSSLTVCRRRRFVVGVVSTSASFRRRHRFVVGVVSSSASLRRGRRFVVGVVSASASFRRRHRLVVGVVSSSASLRRRRRFVVGVVSS